MSAFSFSLLAPAPAGWIIANRHHIRMAHASQAITHQLCCKCAVCCYPCDLACRGAFYGSIVAAYIQFLHCIPVKPAHVPELGLVHSTASCMTKFHEASCVHDNRTIQHGCAQNNPAAILSKSVWHQLLLVSILNNVDSIWLTVFLSQYLFHGSACVYRNKLQMSGPPGVNLTLSTGSSTSVTTPYGVAAQTPLLACSNLTDRTVCALCILCTTYSGWKRGKLRVMSCRVMSCNVVSCRVVSCRVVSCHVMVLAVTLFVTCHWPNQPKRVCGILSVMTEGTCRQLRCSFLKLLQRVCSVWYHCMLPKDVPIVGCTALGCHCWALVGMSECAELR